MFGALAPTARLWHSCAMNYRHIYHAGNICDVVKHVTLLALLAHLRQKPAPFLVLDTHAGCGLYDLQDPAALKTGEAAAGIGRLLTPELTQHLPEYAAALVAANPDILVQGRLNAAACRLYPGSPMLIAGALREQDRYIGCELHPEDYNALRSNIARSPRLQLHQRDGYEALRAFLPPPEKRGLVLVDPPYEQPGEFTNLAIELAAAALRWPQGMFAAWYPLKDRSAVWQFQEAMAGSGIRNQLLLEFTYDNYATVALHGSGLLVINPPWKLAENMAIHYNYLQKMLASTTGQTKIAWLVQE